MRLDPLGLLEKRLESRIPVVLLVGLVVRGNHVEDVVLDGGATFAPALHAHKAALQKTAAAGKVVPDRDLLGLEHGLEFPRLVARNVQDDLSGLRAIGGLAPPLRGHGRRWASELLKSREVRGPERVYGRPRRPRRGGGHGILRRVEVQLGCDRDGGRAIEVALISCFAFILLPSAPGLLFTKQSGTAFALTQVQHAIAMSAMGIVLTAYR